VKRLLIMRHAQAGNASSDYERPLTQHGMEQTAEAAVQMSSFLTPQYILASPSKRTRTTANGVCRLLRLDESSVKYDERIYEASLQSLLYLLQELPESAEDVLLVGHNPGVSYLVSSLCDEAAFGFSPGTFYLLECKSWQLRDLQESVLVSHFSP